MIFLYTVMSTKCRCGNEKAKAKRKGKIHYRTTCNPCRAKDLKKKRQHKKAKEWKNKLRTTKCRDNCSEPPKPYSIYCTRHRALCKNASALQRAKTSTGRSTRSSSTKVAAIEKARHEINETHGIKKTDDIPKPPSRILYKGPDENAALEALLRSDTHGNDYPISAGKSGNRISAANCAGCIIGANSGVKRYLKLAKGEGYVVQEIGRHTEHPMTKSRRRKWTTAQQAILNAALRNPLLTTGTQVWDALDPTLFRQQGVKKNDVMNWWNNHRRRTRSCTPATLDDVRTLIQEFKKTIDKDTGEDEPILLPLPNGMPHLIVGDDVKELLNDDHHKSTTDGTAYSFCLPVTTLRIFKSRIEGAWEQNYRKIVQIKDDDIILEDVPSKGVVMCDGLGDLVLGGVACVIRYGTHTRNTKYRRIGDTLSSGETGINVWLGHMAFDLLAHKLYKLNPSERYMSWCVSDEGKAMTKGIDAFLSMQQEDLAILPADSQGDDSQNEYSHQYLENQDLRYEEHKMHEAQPSDDDISLVDGPAGLMNGRNTESTAWHASFINALLQILRVCFSEAECKTAIQYPTDTIHHELGRLMLTMDIDDIRQLRTLINQLLPTAAQFRARDTPLHEEKLSEDDLDGVDTLWPSSAIQWASAEVQWQRNPKTLKGVEYLLH